MAAAPDGAGRAVELSLPIRVYIEDTDAGGIVYYVNYLKFLERARTEFMRSLGLARDAIFNENMMFVVSDLALDYSAPARLDEELTATAAIRSLRGASLVLAQSVRRGDALLVQGTVTIACVDPQTLQPRRIPRDMLAKLRAASQPSGD